MNGKAELVIQDAKAYEEMASLLDSLKQIALAKNQHENGEAIRAREAFRTLSEKLVAKFPNAGF